MEAIQRRSPRAPLASTLVQRRLDVHAQCVRSLAQNNPRAIADLIARWLREDPHR
jgi:flagellar biosynthesis/type III secretory pathway M-ring protein FliF/YscJ